MAVSKRVERLWIQIPYFTALPEEDHVSEPFNARCDDPLRVCNRADGKRIGATTDGTANVIYLCDPFFKMLGLYKMCTSPSLRPRNDGVNYSGGVLIHEALHVSSILGGLGPLKGGHWQSRN